MVRYTKSEHGCAGRQQIDHDSVIYIWQHFIHSELSPELRNWLLHEELLICKGEIMLLGSGPKMVLKGIVIFPFILVN